MRFVSAIDATGLRALEDLLKKIKKEGVEIIFSGVHEQSLKTMKESGIINGLREDHF